MAAAQLIGDKKLMAALDRLPDKAQRGFWRKQARKGARPIIQSARSKVSVKEGELKRAIKYKDSRRYFGGFVAVDRKRNRGKESMKGSVLAFGAKEERRHKSGKSTGNIKRPIRDFIKEAAEDSGIEAMAIMEKSALSDLEKEIAKLL